MNYNHSTAIFIYKNKSLVAYRKFINTGKNSVTLGVIWQISLNSPYFGNLTPVAKSREWKEGQGDTYLSSLTVEEMLVM